MFEWFNTTLPLMNTGGMTDIAVLRVGPTATGVDLRTLFANRTAGIPTGGIDISAPSGAPNIDAGHFYSIQADGAGPVPTGSPPWRAYMGLAARVRTVDETDVSNSPTGGQCWALIDGQQLRGRIPAGGRDHATGLATGFNLPILNFKCAQNNGTGWLRIYRSSLAEPQGAADEFLRPGFVRF